MQLAGISIPVGRQLLRKTEDVTKTGMGNGEWGMGNGEWGMDEIKLERPKFSA